LGRTALIISIAYVVAMVVVALIALAVVASTRVRGEPDTRRLAEREKAWFVLAVVILTVLLFGTIFFTPYGRSAGSDAQVMEVKALQYAWLVPPTPIEAGKPVEFRLTSQDVSHAFAVFTSSWKLLFQVQVLPGAEQRYVYTFEKPGTYRVVCFEFCGIGHDKMQAQLLVRA
jgi:cytochrome c oxidase subunit 2